MATKGKTNAGKRNSNGRANTTNAKSNAKSAKSATKRTRKTSKPAKGKAKQTGGGSNTRKSSKAKSTTNRTTKRKLSAKSTGSKSTGTSRKTRRSRKPKTVKALDYFNKELKALGAEERTGGWKLNGWYINLNSRGIYPHNKNDEDFKRKFPHTFIQDKGAKPWVPNKELTEDAAASILKCLTINKTKKFLAVESRKAKKAKKAARNRLGKKYFCKGCNFGTHEKSCDHMKSYLEKYGIQTCNNEHFWNYNWCYNAERVYDDPKKIFLGHFNCTKTGERCPYNVESAVVAGEFLLGRVDDEHFTSCDKYEGHRVDTHLIQIKPPVVEVKAKKKAKRKVARKK